ncbi:hypothetical protein SAMN05444392_10671 [Seinonella peptonophila]|uniref:Uncharacterized protein n=1 Tax=Seinonella peptonophila TaxID=112248 RepID=A0A1M4Y6K2_9BACL|nr:hypothetical protein [Seinonella peptonophila]SHF01299.1 hypothetical protein SAMN05444392_10671 [Seinonella peptonophila]
MNHRLTGQNSSRQFLPLKDPRRFTLSHLYLVGTLVLISVFGTFVLIHSNQDQKTGLKSSSSNQIKTTLVNKTPHSTYNKRVAINKPTMPSNSNPTQKITNKKTEGIPKASSKIITTQPVKQKQSKTTALSQSSNKSSSKTISSSKSTSNKKQTQSSTNNTIPNSNSYGYNQTNNNYPNNSYSSNNEYNYVDNNTNDSRIVSVDPNSSGNSYSNEPGYIEGSY